ncbi:MAG: hypothetical protein M0P97_02405, partial [Candidatus Moranbacteria bacterium]|nr:hypothetical protein [Candidatus Moranbacteria bacterium]
ANCKVAEIVVSDYLAKLKKEKVEVLILGCTHYPLLEKTIKKVLGKILVISSAKEVAKELAGRRSIQSDMRKDVFYFSDTSSHYDELTKKILKRKIKVKRKVL